MSVSQEAASAAAPACLSLFKDMILEFQWKLHTHLKEAKVTNNGTQGEFPPAGPGLVLGLPHVAVAQGRCFFSAFRLSAGS